MKVVTVLSRLFINLEYSSVSNIPWMKNDSLFILCKYKMRWSLFLTAKIYTIIVVHVQIKRPWNKWSKHFLFCFFFISVIFHNAKTRCNNGYYSKVYEHFIVLHKYRSILLLGFLTNAPTENNGKNDYLFIINPLCIFVKWHAIINGGL